MYKGLGPRESLKIMVVDVTTEENSHFGQRDPLKISVMIQTATVLKS